MGTAKDMTATIPQPEQSESAKRGKKLWEVA